MSTYVDLALSVQALRRRVERYRSPLGGALGVLARPYPHQVGIVERVLTSPRVRHLLADEVGLGKTLQALMIANALRLQRPGLRTLLVLPHMLVTQWRDEAFCRGHVVPGHDHDDPDDLDAAEFGALSLAWPGRVDAPEIDPAKYDLLIVDEFHKLVEGYQEEIVKKAANFEHLLVLTATPKFDTPSREGDLLQMLEPERVAAARLRVATDWDEPLELGHPLRAWPEDAICRVLEFVKADEDRAAREIGGEGVPVAEIGLELPEDRASEAAARAHCIFRGVVRTRRSDHPGSFPVRVHKAVEVEPVHAEVERQRLMWEYFTRLPELAREFDFVKMAKRVVLSPPSLRQRVSYLRRQGHERDEILERVSELLPAERGDSRLDALIDVLEEVWRNNPDERVLVAAQDNLTVDYLWSEVQARLPEIGPFARRCKLEVARVRQGQNEEIVQDIAAFENENDQALRAFQHENARVLFAPETVQVGLNLQRASVVILYSVPWKAEEVEQWIGRLDRLGGERGHVEVYTIVQRGLADSHVVDALRRYGVFDHSVNLVGEHLKEVGDLIEQAALPLSRTTWRDAKDRIDEIFESERAVEFESPLRHALPWGVEQSTRVHERVTRVAPLEPRLPGWGKPRTGLVGREQALEGWLKLLKSAGEYHVRQNEEIDDPSSKFTTLW